MLSESRDSVIPLSVIMNKTKRKIDELEWDGKLEEADRELKFLAHLTELEACGDVYYPLF